MRRAGAMLAIAFGCAALVAAQQPPTQTTSGSPQTAARTAQSGTITVTGCLQHGDMNATPGTTGTTGATTTAGTPPSRTTSGSGSGASFILTNASSSASGSATGSTAGTTGTTGATTSGATTPRSAVSGTTYALEGTASELSSMNVGKKVEVTGTLDTSSSSTAGTAGTTGTTGAPTTAPGSMSAHPAQKLRVSSVRVVGGDCSAEK